MSKPKYRVNPSLLNKWQELVDADKHWEEFYGNSDEPSISSEDYYRKCEQELLDSLNRVPFVSEASSKGTALNELVDCIVDNRKPMEEMAVERVCQRSEEDAMKTNLIGYRANLDGFSFLFDAGLVHELAEYFKGAICQHLCEAVIETAFGPVIVYGYADYIHQDIVYDLKSTSRYSAYGKFSDGWQKELYPWALIESGEVTNVAGFEYTIVPLSGGSSTTPLITGEIKTEYYDYSHGAATRRLRQVLEAFIPWIEDHRHLIHHPRVFNEQ